jgi:hypothetical protein
MNYCRHKLLIFNSRQHLRRNAARDWILIMKCGLNDCRECILFRTNRPIRRKIDCESIGRYRSTQALLYSTAGRIPAGGWPSGLGIDASRGARPCPAITVRSIEDVAQVPHLRFVIQSLHSLRNSGKASASACTPASSRSLRSCTLLSGALAEPNIKIKKLRSATTPITLVRCST